MHLDILYQDESIVAVNKPHGLLVHRSPIACDAKEFALQILRNQLGRHVFPAHRLDRKTGGVLLFALNEEMLRQLQGLFSSQQMHKTYLAIVRGYTEDEEEIDYPIKKENGNLQEAFTRYKTIRRTEIPVSLGKFNTQRYSLLEATPITGRMHQLRKHFAHILHPIIGDRPHGCNKQNKLFKEKWNMNTMMLHCRALQFAHPEMQKSIRIEAPL
ncbi:MAG: pseudouridine synthase, partial [Cytophagaceae bacterium]